MDKKLEEINVLLDKKKTLLKEYEFCMDYCHSMVTYYYYYQSYLEIKEQIKKLKRAKKEVEKYLT